MLSDFMLQSIVVDEASVQISYYFAEARGPHGVEIRTAVINPAELMSELHDVFDAALQMVTAWHGLQREDKPPSIPRA